MDNYLMPVRNSFEKFFFDWFFILIPSIYAIRLLIQYVETGSYPYALTDFVKISGELAIIIIFALFNIFLGSIFTTLDSLFKNGVIDGHTDDNDDVSITHINCKKNIDSLLNNNLRIVFAGFTAFLAFYYYFSKMGGLAGLFNSSSLLRFLDIFLYFIPTIFYQYFIGIVVWKLIATSWFFQKFPDRYQLTPRFLHPDYASGFLPLGELCIKIMYVAVIPTLLSSFFLLTQLLGQHGVIEYFTPNKTLLFGFIPIILGIGIIGFIIGFIPLYRFHSEIVKQKQRWDEQLHALVERIMVERSKILLYSGDMLAEPIAPMLDNLVKLESFYNVIRKVRLWPLDKALVTNIWSSVVLLGGQIAALIEIVRKLT